MSQQWRTLADTAQTSLATSCKPIIISNEKALESSPATTVIHAPVMGQGTGTREGRGKSRKGEAPEVLGPPADTDCSHRELTWGTVSEQAVHSPASLPSADGCIWALPASCFLIPRCLVSAFPKGQIVKVENETEMIPTLHIV